MIDSEDSSYRSDNGDRIRIMKVFISHAFDDADLARRISDALTTSGFQVWDYSKILPGDNWGAVIGDALRESEAMVVVLTPSSVRSRNLMYDLGYALGNIDFRGRIVPVIAGLPEEISLNDVPWILHRFEIVRLADKSEGDQGLARIAEMLREAA